MQRYNGETLNSPVRTEGRSAAVNDPISLGFSSAYSQAYDAHSKDIYAYFLRRVPAEDAQDAVAETFVVVWRRWHESPADDQVLLWIYGVARNVLANHKRSIARQTRLKQKLLGSPSTRTFAASGAESRSEQDRVLEALSKLSATDQETLRLLEWEGLSREQVAELFGVSRAAIDQRVSRAYRRMGQQLSSEVSSSPMPSAPKTAGAEGSA